MDPTISAILTKLTDQEIKIDKIYKSVEATRKYFLFTTIISILTIVVPLVGLAISLPFLIKTMGSFSSLTGSVDKLNSINSNLDSLNGIDLKQLGL